jgi:hypothetical protein
VGGKGRPLSAYPDDMERRTIGDDRREENAAVVDIMEMMAKRSYLCAEGEGLSISKLMLNC